MRRLFAYLFLSVVVMLPCMAEDILLRNGECVRESDILSKDQFGIIVGVKKDEKTGKMLRKFVPFYDLNSSSLSKFAFCDAKAIERIYTAVQDRAELAQRKFASRFEEYKDQKDYRPLLQIHSGVPAYKALFAAYKKTDTGLIGYMYSDTAEMQFYGIIFLYGLLGNGNEVYTGEIYPSEESFELEGITYPVFTVINPQEDENARAKIGVTSEKKTEAGDKGGGENQMPPPPGDGNMPPPGKDGQQPPPPPQGENGQQPPPPGQGENGQRPPKRSRDDKDSPRGPRPEGGKRGGPGQMPAPRGGGFGGGAPQGGFGGGGPGPR